MPGLPKEGTQGDSDAHQSQGALLRLYGQSLLPQEPRLFRAQEAQEGCTERRQEQGQDSLPGLRNQEGQQKESDHQLRQQEDRRLCLCLQRILPSGQGLRIGS